MPIKRFTSYDGFDLTTGGVHAGLMVDDAFGTWRNEVDERPRPGAMAALGAVAMSARRIAVEFTFPAGATAATINAAFQSIQGGLQPDKPHDPDSPRYLVAELADGLDTAVQRPAVIEGPLEPTIAGGVNGFRVVFVSPDPAWRLVNPTTDTLADIAGNSTVTWETLSLPNDGQARTWPDLLLAVDTVEATGVHRYRRTIEVANNGDQDMVGEAVLCTLGSTTAWVAAGKAAADGSDVYVFREGVEVRRDLIAFNTAYSLMWVYVDHLPAGEAMTLEVVYGDAAGTPLQLTGQYRPAFDNRGATGELTAGSTATVLNVGGSPGWDTDQWKDGRLRMISGARSGEEANVSSSATAAITLASALTGAPASGDDFVVWNSRNDRLVWRVSVNERGDLYRGLWRLNASNTKPTDVRFDAPGSWEHHLYLKNNDVFNQSAFAWLEASGDFDPYAILDADRCGQGVSSLQDAGAADGVAYHDVFPLTKWHFDGQFKNPNGMCEAFFGSREDETRDWTEVRSVTTATDAVTLTSFSAVDNTLATGTRHLVAAVLPIDGASIGPDWARITGSRTAGGGAAASTVTDGTLAGRYDDDQFVEGRLTVVRGTGQGRTRTVTDYAGSTGQFTVSGTWGVDLDDSSQFEVVNKRLVATLRTNTRWYVERDVSDLSVGAVSAEADNYPASLIVGMDSGASGTDYPYHRLRIGQADRVLFLGVDDVLYLNCAEKRALRLFGSAGEEDLTAYVRSEYVRSATDHVEAEEWLPMAPGAHTLKILNGGAATFDLTARIYEGFLG